MDSMPFPEHLMPRDPAPGNGEPELTGDGTNPTHHVVLEDVYGRQLGFVITDAGGDMNETSFRRFPMADPVTPYTTTKQEAFQGFGEVRHEDNKANYWFSTGVDTTKGKIVLGPEFKYATSPWRDNSMHQPGDSDNTFQWVGLHGTSLYMAAKSTTSFSVGVTADVKFWVKRKGNPGRLRVRIISDSGGNPTGTTRDTGYLTASDYDKDEGQWVKVALSAWQPSGTYWVVIDGAVDYTPTADNCWEIALDGTQSTGKQSANGSSWNTSIPGEFFYRLSGLRVDFTPRFYTYKGQMYFIASYNSLANSRIFMNGYRGACDSNVGALTQLKDSTQTGWASLTGDEVARIISGTSAGEEVDWRRITGGGSGYATCTPAWGTNHATDSDYIVIGSDNFSEITSSGGKLVKNLTDVAVVDGIVYFCRGNTRNILTHREINTSGTWDFSSSSCWDDSRNVQAQFAQVINDPVGGPVIWFGENPNQHGETQPSVCKAEPTSWGEQALNYQTLLLHAGVDGQDVPWTPSTGDVSVSVTAKNEIIITVTIGQIGISGISISNGGSGYTDGSGKTFKIVDPGSSQTAVISCTISSGAVTSIDSVSTAGHSYTTGTKNTTVVSGGGSGTGFQVSVNAVDGFTTGKLAFANFVDPDDTAYTVDLRNMNLLSLQVEYQSLVKGATQTLDDGDVTFDLDNSTDAGSPYVNIGLNGMVWDSRIDENEYISMDLSDYADAASTASCSFTLTQAKTRSFKLVLRGKSYALRDIKPVAVGSLDFDNITGMQSYGDPENLWVFTETALGEVRNNYFLGLPQREIKTARHPNNGKGNEVSDVYLLFTWRGRLQRYFRQNLEDLGPDFPFELGDMQSEIVDVVTYPGRVYVAIDGGTGKSMVLCHKGGGWHEVFTSFDGEPIRGLFIQAVPGRPDRLWFGCGSDMMYVPIILDSAELPSNSNYRFRGSGNLTTSWVYSSDPELNKLFRSAVVTMQRANDNDLKCVLQYQVDDEDSTWHTADRVDDMSASAKEYFFGDYSHGSPKSGNRIRLKIILETKDITKSPVVRAVQHKMYRMPTIKYSYSWLSKASSISINVRGDEERVAGTKRTVQEAIELMDHWSKTTMPLKTKTNISVLQGKLVILEPLPTQLLMLVPDEKIEEQIVQIAVNDA